MMSSLSAGRITLWCYLIWYLSTVFRYFDPAPAVWLNSLGISLATLYRRLSAEE